MRLTPGTLVSISGFVRSSFTATTLSVERYMEVTLVYMFLAFTLDVWVSEINNSSVLAYPYIQPSFKCLCQYQHSCGFLIVLYCTKKHFKNMFIITSAKLAWQINDIKDFLEMDKHENMNILSFHLTLKTLKTTCLLRPWGNDLWLGFCSVCVLVMWLSVFQYVVDREMIYVYDWMWVRECYWHRESYCQRVLTWFVHGLGLCDGSKHEFMFV